MSHMPPYAPEQIISGLGLQPPSMRPAVDRSGRDEEETGDHESEWIENILEGEHLHESTLRLAASLVARGMTGGGAVKHIRSLMDLSTADRDDRFRARYRDVPRLVREAEKGGFALSNDRRSVEHGRQQAEALMAAIAVSAKEPRFKLLTGNDIRALPWLRWRVRGVLPAVGLAVIFGEWGTGKSFLAFDLGAHIADSPEWFGHRVECAPVVYMVLEGEGGIRQRAAAWEAHHGRPLPAEMLVCIQPFKITEPQDIVDLASVIPAGAVVFIDTLNRTAPTANENGSDDMGVILEGSKQLQTAIEGLVVLVHHAGKNAERGMRGHSSLPAAADAAIEVSRMGDHRAWKVAKAKDGEDGGTQPFQLEIIRVAVDEYGDPITSCAVVPDQAPAPALDTSRQSEPSGKNQKLALNALRLVLPLADSVSKSVLDYEEAVSVAAEAMPYESSQRKYRARLAIEGLIKGGYLHREGDAILINYGAGSP